MAMNDRTKVLLGVAVLALAGGAAWFLYFADDGAPPPAPQKVASTAPMAPKPVAVAPKPPAQVQPLADTKPATEAATPAAEAPKPAAEAAKPAAEPAKPVAQEAKPETPKPMARKHLRRNEDARHCLDKSTNTEIIKCAEAYL